METITPDFWQRIKACAAEALDLAPADREGYIARACATDPLLGEQVRSLVASALAATPYFEQPVSGGILPSLYAAGHHIGPYRIVRELGSGGMGSVYLAERDDGEFLQRAAIKIVRGGFVSSFLLQRFREERRILASLEHPNIARLLEGGTTTAGLPYVVMEYIEGEPIDRYCGDRRLSLRERLAIFQQVCAAVQYAHQHLVIHRDIKPGNILVTADGTPKLLDFGIAKLLDSETGFERSTHTTLHVMTPESASPEQVEGKPVSVAADVYALGVLLYRLLTARSPHGEPPPEGAELIRVVCEQIPERPSLHSAIPGQTVPFDVDMIVMKALRKEPERRYGSAGEFSDDVQRFLDGRPVLASPDSLRYRGRKFVSRHRAAVAAAAALAIAIGAGVAATAWQAHVADRERTRAEREFNAVRGIARTMLGEVHEAVSKLPGSTPAREILLLRGTEYLDALSAEAAGDDGLRREVAMDYVQLSKAQGGVSASTLGDSDAARKSLAKAASLLDPLVARPGALAGDRVRLATVLAERAALERGAASTEPLRKARALLDGLTPAEQAVPSAVVAREMIWQETATLQVAARDYAGAEISQQHYVEAAEEQLRLAPQNLDCSYNLSLGYKYRGASLEMLDRRAEALVLYNKALVLDQQRVAAEPGRTTWRLDLSFSQGSIAAARLAVGDLEGGRAGYEQTVATREEVVRQDPHDDFARQALARGYDRLAGAYAELGKVTPALEFHDKALRIYRDRLDAHPEREQVWRDYASASYNDAKYMTVLMERFTRKDQRVLASWADGVLDRLQAIQHRWTKEGHPGALGPAAADVQAQRAIVARAR